jgi:hypothetical protein
MADAAAPHPSLEADAAIRALARAFVTGARADADALRLAPAGEIARAAVRLGVSYQVGLALRSARGETPGLDELRAALKPHRLAALASSVKLFEDAKAVVRALDGRGVDHVPHKGPFLSIDLYGTPDARASSDIDVVLPGGRSDVERAVEALAAIGYAVPAASAVVKEYYARECREFTLVCPTRFPVDLHYGSYPDLPESAFAAAARRSRRLTHEAFAFRAFAPADLMAILSAHLWGVPVGARLRWLLDIALLVKRADAFAGDWAARLAAWRATFLVASAVEAAGHDLGVAPPEGVRAALARMLSSRERAVCSAIAARGADDVRFGAVQKLHRLRLPLKARLRAVRRYLLPHPGRVALESGRPDRRPGALDRLRYAAARLVAALRA